MVMQSAINRYRFLSECGWPGKVHDARVLRNSKIFEDGQAGRLFPNRPERIGTCDFKTSLIGDPARLHVCVMISHNITYMLCV